MEGNHIKANEGHVEANEGVHPNFDKPTTSNPVVTEAPGLTFWDNVDDQVEISKTLEDNCDGWDNVVKYNARRARLRKAASGRIKRDRKKFILNAAMRTINSLPGSEGGFKKSTTNSKKTEKLSKSMIRKSSSEGGKNSKRSTQPVLLKKGKKIMSPVKRIYMGNRAKGPIKRVRATNETTSDSSFTYTSSESDSQAKSVKYVVRSRGKGPPAKKKKTKKFTREDEGRSDYTSGQCSDSGCSDCGIFGFGGKSRRKKKKKRKQKKKKPCCC